MLQFTGPNKAMGPAGLPAINTAILLLSSVTVTIAHHALRQDHRKPLIIWLAATVALGATFLFFQVEEYVHAYQELGLTMDSGIYGSTFFMLTGLPRLPRDHGYDHAAGYADPCDQGSFHLRQPLRV